MTLHTQQISPWRLVRVVVATGPRNFRILSSEWVTHKKYVFTHTNEGRKRGTYTRGIGVCTTMSATTSTSTVSKKYRFTPDKKKEKSHKLYPKTVCLVKKYLKIETIHKKRGKQLRTTLFDKEAQC